MVNEKIWDSIRTLLSTLLGVNSYKHNGTKLKWRGQTLWQKIKKDLGQNSAKNLNKNFT